MYQDAEEAAAVAEAVVSAGKCRYWNILFDLYDDTKMNPIYNWNFLIVSTVLENIRSDGEFHFTSLELYLNNY